MAQAEVMDRTTGEIVVMSERLVTTFDNAQIELIKNTIMPRGSSAQEFEMFLYQCKRTGLDPITRQIYALKVDNKVSVQVSIDGFRLIAERSGKYAGQLGPFWCGEDGVWQDVWLQGAPAACKVAVLRSDFKEPCWGVARFASYRGGFMWNKMPDLMIAKVAEALALRRAFPQELSGLYTSDEMQQAGGGDEMPSEKPVERRAAQGSAERVQTTPPPATNGATAPPSASRDDAVAQWRNARDAIDACNTIPELDAIFACAEWDRAKEIMQQGDPAKAAGAIQQLVDRAEARKGLLMGNDGPMTYGEMGDD